MQFFDALLSGTGNQLFFIADYFQTYIYLFILMVSRCDFTWILCAHIDKDLDVMKLMQKKCLNTQMHASPIRNSLDDTQKVIFLSVEKLLL
jgi:hypothetical protein